MKYLQQRLLIPLTSSQLLPDRLRPSLLRHLGVSVGPRVVALAGLVVTGGGRVTLAEGAYLNRDCFIDASSDVHVGVRVSIASHVRLVTSTHEVGELGRRAGRTTTAPVIIGDGTWIGTGAIVLPGVTIGEGCIIGAGTVVTGDCEPDGMYVGVPARRVRDLPPRRDRQDAAAA
jgi:maltose O-acetyltransferase